MTDFDRKKPMHYVYIVCQREQAKILENSKSIEWDANGAMSEFIRRKQCIVSQSLIIWLLVFSQLLGRRG
jgi:hypothetical protein